jgi:hypothetical protein
MLRRLFQFLVVGSTLASSAAVDIGTVAADTPEAIDVRVRSPGYTILEGIPALEPGSGAVNPAFATAVSNWLAAEFDLPHAKASPAFAMVPESRLASLRLRGVDTYRSNVGLAAGTVVAVYDDEARTIYLPEGWTGATAAELSIVVHEMVHHLQKEAGLKYACPEEREQLAFAAQERWLALFGTDLMTEFELDPFTLLVRTNCPY